MKSSKFNFNIIQLKEEVNKLAEDYLTEITEENVKLFSESIKMVGESTLEDYYLKIDEHYSEGVYKIKDEETLQKFMDFADGYRYSMKSWARENEIKLEKVEITDTDLPQQPNYNTNKPKIILGVGTVIAVGVCIISNIWVALLAEILVIGIAYKTMRDQKKQDERYQFEMKKYKVKIEADKTKLINGLTEDIIMWLEKAETKSNQLLENFKVL